MLDGQLDRAAEVTDALERECARAGLTRESAEAVLLSARCALEGGHPQRTVDRLFGFDPPDTDGAALRDAYLARALVLTARYRDGLQRADRLSDVLDGLPPSVARNLANCYACDYRRRERFHFE